MTRKHFKTQQLLPAAFLILSAAVFSVAQSSAGQKHNTRPEVPAPAPGPGDESHKSLVRYSYEFKQPEFPVSRIVIEHDAGGRGRISFEKRNDESPVVEPLELSAATVSRISSLWQALRFLDSAEDYQSDRQYAHLGTMRLKMEEPPRQRVAEFNWTNNKEAFSLVNEYRRVADQAIWIFDISVARESQPLNTPKLMETLEGMLKRNWLSDPQQLIPILKDLSKDEHVPLIARNHATRLLKKLEK